MLYNILTTYSIYIFLISPYDATEFSPLRSINLHTKKARTGNYCAVSMLSYLCSIVVEGKEQGERTGNKADPWPSREIEEEII